MALRKTLLACALAVATAFAFTPGAEAAGSGSRADQTRPYHVYNAYRYHGGIAYYNGHRGIRYHRPGYRAYRGFYFPRSAFSVTVNVGPRIVSPRRHTKPRIISVGAQHVAWCQGRYKTYRASDNTYAYKVGHRTYCRSPYSR